MIDEQFYNSKFDKKENRTNAWKNKHEKAGLQSTIHHVINLYTKYDNSSFKTVEKSLTKNLRGMKEGQK